MSGRGWQDRGGVRSQGSRAVALGIGVCGGKASEHRTFLKLIDCLKSQNDHSSWLVTHFCGSVPISVVGSS